MMRSDTTRIVTRSAIAQDVTVAPYGVFRSYGTNDETGVPDSNLYTLTMGLFFFSMLNTRE